MKKEKHLPLYGVGPIYGIAVVALTAAGIVLSALGLLPSGRYARFFVPVNCLAALLIVLGVTLWIKAVIQSKIDDNIQKNHLVTTGVYAWARNPIYSAFLFVCTGAILLAHNLWLLNLPPIYWVFLTVLMKHTEEKWLLAQYGAEYKDYCKKTNRCIPWFPQGEIK